jgi:hypothetical protein
MPANPPAYLDDYQKPCRPAAAPVSQRATTEECASFRAIVKRKAEENAPPALVSGVALRYSDGWIRILA